ncbi:hypothetical protein GcM1_243055 [Golovinomyces cichoracearum]|uniref:Uncharacterized protein n=1 Tax=Golovinomyces cichoracearum TaxID=62708 RepID=A0A420IGC6_9PEZI|nr:hypothetical protein GcM1_243055 [Golovinomyces cichoracearum]
MKKRVASVHSRAAKRASSPGINLDKSLKDIKPPPSTQNVRPSILLDRRSAGIMKKTKGGRKAVLSAKIKRRQEKGLDRAVAVMDRTIKKVERSKDKAKIGQERSMKWEDLNKKMALQTATIGATLTADIDLMKGQENSSDEQQEKKSLELPQRDIENMKEIAAESAAQYSIPMYEKDTELKEDEDDEIL